MLEGEGMYKLLIMDVDGTLTDGKIYMGSNGEIMKAFDVKDGYAITKILPTLGITPIIITGRESEIVKNRALELNIKHLYQGVHDKLSAMKQIVSQMEYKLDDVIYIGDDINDLPCLKVAGFSACPADAVDEIKNVCTYVCRNKGGCGAVRELINEISTL